MRPGRYKPRILRFRDMTAAANCEYVLRRPRDLDAFAAMWRSHQPAARCTGVVSRFPHQVTSRHLTLVRSSTGNPYTALRQLSSTAPSAPNEILQ